MSSLLNNLSSNTIFLGGFGLIITGLVSYWMKEIPLRLWGFVVRTFTTSISVTNQHKTFYDLLRYVQNYYKDRTFRSLKVNNGMWGNDDKKTISIGYGTHYINYKNNYIKIEYSKMDSHDRDDKEIITLTKIGRSNDIFIDLIKSTENINENSIKLYDYDGHSHWEFKREIPKRNFNSIYISKEIQDNILSTIDNFKNNKTWYAEHGIPYQLGLLLKGPPGTGKTSIIKAIASHFDFAIYYISVNKIANIQEAFSNIPNDVLVVIEDIDGSVLTHSRESGKYLDNKHEDKDSKSLIMSISEILNAIDGIFAPSGRILITTTNKPEILDEALIRPGRIDKQYEIGYVDIESLTKFINAFYPDSNIDYSSIQLQEGITTATLQNYVQSKMTVDEIITKISN